MNQLLLSLISGLAGSALTLWVTFARDAKRQAADEARRRKAVATALVHELSVVERTIKGVFDGNLGHESAGALGLPIHDRFSDYADLFDADTVVAVLEFASHVAAVRAQLEQLAVRAGGTNSIARQSAHDALAVEREEFELLRQHAAIVRAPTIATSTSPGAGAVGEFLALEQSPVAEPS